MRKLLAILMICIFAITFAVGAMVSTANAKLPCTAACIGGHLRVCCYFDGVYQCRDLGPCLLD